MRDGRTTSDLEEDATAIVIEVAGGDAERLRLVVGRPRPFFLKNGTVMFSVSAIMKKQHADGIERRGGSKAGIYAEPHSAVAHDIRGGGRRLCVAESAPPSAQLGACKYARRFLNLAISILANLATSRGHTQT